MLNLKREWKAVMESNESIVYSDAMKRAVLNSSSVIQEIFANYPKISPNAIDMMVPVYYPTAQILISFNEKTFENLETVPAYILRLIETGIQKPEMIADIMGLPRNYINGVLNMLRADGQANETNGGKWTVPKSGKASLKENKLVKNLSTSAVFQMDALNARLIRLDDRVHTAVLRNKKYLRNEAVIEPPEGFSTGQIEKDLMDNADIFLRDNADLLHVNVTAINKISLSAMDYTDALLVQMKDEQLPLIFCRRKPASTTRVQKRIAAKVMPFSVPDQKMIEKYGLESYLPVETDKTRKLIREAMQRYARNTQYTDKDIIDSLPLIFDCIDFSKVSIAAGKRSIRLQVYCDSFTTFSYTVMAMIARLSSNAPYMAVSSLWSGRYLAVTSDDPVLLDISRMAQKYGLYSLAAQIGSSISHNAGREMIYDIQKCLKDMETAADDKNP